MTTSICQRLGIVVQKLLVTKGIASRSKKLLAAPGVSTVNKKHPEV